MAYVAGDSQNIHDGIARIKAEVAQMRTCRCLRCRGRGLTGPAVLVTLGVLFLLSEFQVASFGRTWPILLIVIGLVKVLAGNLDNTGHIDVLAAAPEGTQPPTPPQNSGPGEVNHV